MLEYPETQVVGRQINEMLTGKVITSVFTPTNPHKFAFFDGDVEEYKPLFTGRKIVSARGFGMFIDIQLDNDVSISVGDGVTMKYGDSSSKIPDKYQLLLVFSDETFLVFTIAMYGMIAGCKGVYENKYHTLSLEKISPLSDEFDKSYFEGLMSKEKGTLSVKGLLATEQRIPGLGNGSLQDILFHAKIHPKRKISTLSEEEIDKLFHCVKDTLLAMTHAGGRDTETTLLGNKGGYKSVLSAKTYKNPCPVCGGTIIKEAYLGGSVYYCSICQKI